MNSKECGDNISDIDGEHFADVDCDCHNDVAEEASLNSGHYFLELLFCGKS